MSLNLRCVWFFTLCLSLRKKFSCEQMQKESSFFSNVSLIKLNFVKFVIMTKLNQSEYDLL